MSPFVDSANFSFDGGSDISSTQYRSQSSFDKSQEHSNSPQSSSTYIQSDELINEENDDMEIQLTNSTPVEDRDTIIRKSITKEKRKSG